MLNGNSLKLENFLRKEKKALSPLLYKSFAACFKFPLK